MGKVKTKVGFGEKVREIEVDVPDGEPAPWGAGAKLTVVGTDVVRVDAAMKASGRAKYTYDINLRDMLCALVLHAPYGAAQIKKLDTSKAEKMPGVKGVLPFKKAGDPIRYHGDEVAAVAAETEDQAEDALHAIEVEYDRKPVVTTIATAMAAGAPQVFPGRENVRPGRGGQPRGDAEGAIKSADKVVEAAYETQVQTHSSFEPHGTVAKFNEDGSLTVWCSTQATFGIRQQAQQVAGRGTKVRVFAEFVGGGFGSKFGLHVTGAAAIRLAKQTGRPVKCMCTRESEHTTGGNRPSSLQKMKAGLDKDGQIQGLIVETFGSGGIGGGGGCANPIIYSYGAGKKTESDVFVNGGPAAAFRAPRHPQGIFALDSFMDECAHAAGLDPLEFRKKHSRDEVYRAQWDLGAKMIGWERRNKEAGKGSGHLRRGIGMASTRWGQIGAPGSRVDVIIRDDGTVEAHNGAQDIGTGTKTVLATIVAEELGLKPPQVAVKMGDTDLPMGPGSGGSVTAPSVGPAARNAGIDAKEKLAELAAKKLGVEAKDVVFADGKVGTLKFEEACKLIEGGSLRGTGERRNNYATYRGGVAGCQFADVEVDIETGRIRPVKVVAVQDAGRVISKLTFESQVLGGVIQGISYALYEDRILDRNVGTQMNADFLNYKIAGPADMPEIEVVAFSIANAGNNCGMAGLGEPPTIPTAAAIANAVFNATGLRLRSLPMTPDKVLAAAGKKEW